MISETFIYDRDKSVFRTIINKVSQTIKFNSYNISPDYGHNVNTNNLRQYLRDPKFGMRNPETKYPMVVLVAPRSVLYIQDGVRFEKFLFTLYFLERQYYDGFNQHKQRNTEENLSEQNFWEDWANMKRAAILFLNYLETAIRKHTLTIGTDTPKFLLYISSTLEKVDVKRLAEVTEDKLNGVEVTFTLDLNQTLCDKTTGEISYTFPST